MSATDCLSHPWLKRLPPAPTAKINGTHSPIITNELDLQKDVLRGIVDRWNCDINGDANSKPKIIEFEPIECGDSENLKPIQSTEAAAAKKKIEKQTSLPNGNAPPPRKKENGQIKLITKGVVTGLVSGFEPKKVAEKPLERCRMNGDVKKLNGLGDRNKFNQSSGQVKNTEEAKMKNTVSKVPSKNEESPKLVGDSTPSEKVDTKSPDTSSAIKQIPASQVENKKSVNDTKLVPAESKELSKLPSNMNNTAHSITQGKNVSSSQYNETSQNSQAVVGSQISNSEKVPCNKTELSKKTTGASSASKNSPISVESSPIKLLENENKTAAKTEVKVEAKTGIKSETSLTEVKSEACQKTGSSPTPTTTENKMESSPKPQKKIPVKSSTDRKTSPVPQSTNDSKTGIKISRVPSKSEINKQSLDSSKSTSPARGRSPNALSPHSAKKSETSPSPTSSRTSPSRLAASPEVSRSKKSIQVEEDDDSFQCMRKRNFLIQNIIENYEQKAQKANADLRKSSKVNVDALLDGEQLVDFFSSPKLTQRRISDITSLLSGSDNVERSIEEMKAFCKNLSQMVRMRQDSITEDDTKFSSKRPKFRISCFSRDVPLVNSSGSCTTNLFNYVPWYDAELSTSWNLAKSNTHSDPGSLRNSPEPLAPPSLTSKILSKFFNNSIEYGMAGVPSSQHATPKDKVAEILS